LQIRWHAYKTLRLIRHLLFSASKIAWRNKM